MGHRAGLDAVEKRKNLLSLPEIKPKFFGRPAHSPSLYKTMGKANLVYDFKLLRR
jgi:hypothetical protein